MVAKAEECADLRGIVVEKEVVVQLSDRVKKIKKNRLFIISVMACSVLVVVALMFR